MVKSKKSAKSLHPNTVHSVFPHNIPSACSHYPFRLFSRLFCLSSQFLSHAFFRCPDHFSSTLSLRHILSNLLRFLSVYLPFSSFFPKFLFSQGILLRSLSFSFPFSLCLSAYLSLPLLFFLLASSSFLSMPSMFPHFLLYLFHIFS